MLYERWLQISRQHASERALSDSVSGVSWTFAELDELASAPPAGSGYVCPTGNSPEFVVTVLRAWRHGRVLCPLESGQEPPRIPSPPAGCVHLKTTSGSTGKPRAIAFTAAQLAADADNIVSTMGLRRDWPNLGAISLAHSYGFSNLVTPLLLHGIPLVLAPSALPTAILASSRQLTRLTLAAVPAMWRAWLDAGVIPRQTCLAISAGAPLPLDLERGVFERHQLKVHNFYGATECGGIAYDRSTIPRLDGASVGSALDGVRLARGDDGCLEVRSAAVAETCWPEPDSRIADGCYRTSDLVEIAGQEIRLQGRVADVINVAGRKIAPETIEAVLRRSPMVRESVVFGVPAPDAARGEVIVACVQPGAATTIEGLRSFAQENLSAWQVPKEWWLVDALEADARGKLSRAIWRTRFLAR
jgi:acyl-coenzyme A synthetase/AMP-(fatty) acid ligase